MPFAGIVSVNTLPLIVRDIISLASQTKEWEGELLTIDLKCEITFPSHFNKRATGCSYFDAAFI